MNENNLAEFTILMREEAELYPNASATTAARIQAYFESLQRFDLPVICEAFRGLRESLGFFPTIKDLVGAIEGSGEDRAACSWATFLDASADGGYSSVKFLDLACAYAVQMIFVDWLRACRILHDADEAMIAHYRKAFCAAYALARMRPRPAVEYHPGLFQIENSQRAAPFPLVRIISLPVLIIGLRESKEIRLDFDLSQRDLTAASRAALFSPKVNDLRELIERNRERYAETRRILEIAPGNDEPASLEEVKLILSDLRGSLPSKNPYLGLLDSMAQNS